MTKQQDVTISIAHYLKNMAKLADQWTPLNYRDVERQRLYLKDIDCPDAWFRYLSGILPPELLYLNECSRTSDDAVVLSAADIAPAGDLMSSLPSDMRAENLMSYIGPEGTYTPAHREMCASLGQNIMVDTSGDGLDPWGQREKPGSSIWFMTESKDRYLVSEYWLSILGHDIEVESHFAQVNAWKNAPFKTWVVDQRKGDFILIPPLAPHQVWNRGTRTVKVAWNRTTPETLEMALDEALPRARMVCRDEQYKNKAIVYYTLIKYAGLLRRIDRYRADGWSAAALRDLDADRKVRLLRKDFRRLFRLFTGIILSESFAVDADPPKNVQYLPYDSNVTCAYCRCNIFNRFLTCPTCVDELPDGQEDAYDVCMECYAMGRSCACLSGLRWVEQFRWSDLCDRYDDWRNIVIAMDDDLDSDSRPPLNVLRRDLEKKTLAQVCQEQLKLRPWRDIQLPPPTRAEEQGIDEGDDDDDDDDDDDNNDDGDGVGRRRSRRKRRRSTRTTKNSVNCHICKHREVSWKLARCVCGTAYCYGVLFRAFDLMPLEVMENPRWRCPKCRKICSCGQCRRDDTMTPYQPTGTLVGHDTKRVADPRSVESLVDFGRSNLSWLKRDEEPQDGGHYETARLRRFREQADRDKAQDQRDHVALIEDDPDLIRQIHEARTVQDQEDQG